MNSEGMFFIFSQSPGKLPDCLLWCCWVFSAFPSAEGASLPRPQLCLGAGPQFKCPTSHVPEASLLSPHGSESRGLQVPETDSSLFFLASLSFPSCELCPEWWRWEGFWLHPLLSSRRGSRGADG